MLHSHQFGAQAQSRLQAPVSRAVQRVIRRTAVDRYAGAHPVRAFGQRFAVAQQGRAVAQAAFTGQVVGDRLKGLKLRGNAGRPVGVAEVRHERNLVNLRQRAQPCPGGAKSVGLEAQPVHATVHLEEHALRQLRFVGGQHVDLFIAMNDMPQTQARAQLEVARFKNTLEQQDRPAPVHCAQALRLVEIEQCKAICRPQALEYPFNAMAISVGFDHSPNTRIAGGHLQCLQVVAQRLGMNSCKNRTGHVKKLKGKHQDQVGATVKLE